LSLGFGEWGAVGAACLTVLTTILFARWVTELTKRQNDRRAALMAR
jgi:hypothetical protein